MAAHTNKIMNISLKRNLGTFTYLFCFTLLVSCVSAEVAPKTSNIKPATGFGNLIVNSRQPIKYHEWTVTCRF